ncbi:MAG: response regulator transcription factor [Burkholderiaceae bacterium]|nr:response regulator transcription factor [Burkholderiaceae bacterium]
MRYVLIVEDHPLVAEATSRLLTHGGDEDLQIVTCATAAGTLENLNGPGQAWYRIFLDLAVPGAFGLSLAKQVRSAGMASLCCVISAFDRDDYVRQLQTWGFLGYIPKSMPVDAFAARLNDAMRGLGSFPAITPASRTTSIRLTNRQTEILELIQLGRSSKQIAALINLAEGTVNNQVAALMHALQADSRSHAVAKAIELGLIDVGSGQSEERLRATFTRSTA